MQANPQTFGGNRSFGRCDQPPPPFHFIPPVALNPFFPLSANHQLTLPFPPPIPLSGIPLSQPPLHPPYPRPVRVPDLVQDCPPGLGWRTPPEEISNQRSGPASLDYQMTQQQKQQQYTPAPRSNKPLPVPSLEVIPEDPNPQQGVPKGQLYPQQTWFSQEAGAKKGGTGERETEFQTQEEAIAYLTEAWRETSKQLNDAKGPWQKRSVVYYRAEENSVLH